MLIVRKKEWAFHCWKVHSYADCELHERRNALLIAGIYRTLIIVLVPQGAATIKALIRFGIVKHAEQLFNARCQQIISAPILLNHENNIPGPGSGSTVVLGFNAGWQKHIFIERL